MPYETVWVDPDVALTHVGPKGEVTIYHTYMDDETEQGQRTYIFTTKKEGSECDDDAFDIRDLQAWDDVYGGVVKYAPSIPSDIAVLMRAIETGEIEPDEDAEDEEAAATAAQEGALCPS